MAGLERAALRLCPLAGALIGLTGCQPAALESSNPALAESRPVSVASAMRRKPPQVLPARETAPRINKLTMRAAMQRAVRYSPVLRAVAEEKKARRAETYQAGRRPNPELTTEIENFAGSGDFEGFKSAETTISLTQVIELGRKRMNRMRVASLDEDLANWDYEAARLTIASQTQQAFVDVLASQKRLSVHRAFATLATRLTDTVRERVDAGKVSPVELSRSEVERARASVTVREEQAKLQAAKRKLSLFWGARRADFGTAVGRLAATNHLPSPERFQSYLDRNPTLARWVDEMAKRQATLELERARRIPDLTVGAGVRQIGETDDTAAVATFSIPLPFFNRNRGNIDAASARVTKSLYERDAARIGLNSRFIEAYGVLRASEAKLRALQNEVLPAARKAFDATERGYREGKFDLLNALDARRSLIQAQLDVVDTQAEFHKAKALIEGLIGRDLYSL